MAYIEKLLETVAPDVAKADDEDDEDDARVSFAVSVVTKVDEVLSCDVDGVTWSLLVLTVKELELRVCITLTDVEELESVFVIGLARLERTVVVDPGEEEADGVEPMLRVITLDVPNAYSLAPTVDELMLGPVTGEDETAPDESESLVVAELVVPETVNVSVPEGTTDVVDPLPPVARLDVSGEPLPVVDDDELMLVLVTGEDETKLNEDETVTVTEPLVREMTVGNDAEGDIEWTDSFPYVAWLGTPGEDTVLPSGTEPE
ncbi:hypothetical protein LTR50_004242 [Elasticomyces elasticus]|nr:hypothetical protein LTR50_004242 [Elasticomyces elasticus]